MSTNRLYSIGEVAEELNRVPHTIRIWLYKGIVPENLLPSRDERNWRWWTEEQVCDLKQWVIDEDLRPGKGLITVGKK